MSNLSKRFAAKSTKALFEITERREDFSAKALAAAEAEIGFRQLPEAELQGLMELVNRERIVKMLNTFNPLNDTLAIPTSYWLTESRMRELLKEEFALLLERKDGFRFDVMKYAIGGL